MKLADLLLAELIHLALVVLCFVPMVGRTSECGLESSLSIVPGMDLRADVLKCSVLVWCGCRASCRAKSGKCLKQ